MHISSISFSTQVPLHLPYRLGGHAALIAAGTILGRVCRLPLKHCLGWSLLAIGITELIHQGKQSWSLDLIDSTLTTGAALGLSYITKQSVDFRTVLAMQIIGKLASYLVHHKGQNQPNISTSSSSQNKSETLLPVEPNQNQIMENQNQIIEISASNHPIKSLMDKVRDELPQLWNAKCLFLDNAYDPINIEFSDNQSTLIFEHTYEKNPLEQKRPNNHFLQEAISNGHYIALNSEYNVQDKGAVFIAIQFNGTTLTQLDQIKPLTSLLFPSREEVIERISHGKKNGTAILTEDERRWVIYEENNRHYLSQRGLDDQGYAQNEVASCWGGGCGYASDIELSNDEWNQINDKLKLEDLEQKQPNFIYLQNKDLSKKNEVLIQGINNAYPASNEVNSLRATKEQIFESVYLGNLAALEELYSGNYVSSCFDDFGNETSIQQEEIAFTRVISVIPRKQSLPQPGSKNSPNKIKHFDLRIDETPALMANIIPQLHEAFALIDQARLEDKPILIHCQQGKHRSAFIVASYLVYTLKMEPANIIAFLKKRRALVELKDGCEGNRPVEVALRWLYQAAGNS